VAIVKFSIGGKDGSGEARSIDELLRNLHIPVSSVITLVDGKIRPEDHELKDGEKITIIDVSTGG